MVRILAVLFAGQILLLTEMLTASTLSAVGQLWEYLPCQSSFALSSKMSLGPGKEEEGILGKHYRLYGELGLFLGGHT